MSGLKTFVVPGLATVTLDTEDDNRPLLSIRLDPAYAGDLNDIEQNNEFGPGIYLECNSVSCIDNANLAKFIEVMAHWDHDHDGKFDADTVVTAIEDAFWASREKPYEFRRSQSDLYTRALMRLMPPAPARHIVFSFGELRKRFGWRHYAIAVPTMVLVIAVLNIQTTLWPVMGYSVITGVMAIGQHFGINPILAWFVFYFAWSALNRRFSNDKEDDRSFSTHTYGFFNRAAISEEQAFREGAENWSFGQRAMSCFVFGAVHMMNLIYPLATILPLALGGAVFMGVYLHVYRKTRFRRSAVLASAIVHRVYNRIALAALVIWLVGTLGLAALKIFGIGIATLLFFTLGLNAVDALRQRRKATAKQTPLHVKAQP